MGREEDYYIEGAECIRASDMALLIVSDEFDGPEWVPRSQVCSDSDVLNEGDTGLLVVTGWFAKQREWC